MSNLLSRVKADHAAQQLKSTLGNKFEATQVTVAGTIVAANLVAVGGQQYRSAGITGAAGDIVSVRNIGTPAVAIFGPSGGGGAVLASSSHSSESSGGTDHPAVTLATPAGLQFADQPTQAGLSIADSLAGDGLSITNKVMAVGAGALIAVNASDVALANGAAQYQVPVTGASPFTPGWTALSSFAGSGLAFAGGAFAVGAGNMITVNADNVQIADGVAYQFIGTFGTSATWRNLSELAGAGLTMTNGVLAVGAGNGITVNANDVALTTPGTLAVATTNSSSGSHTHAITSSSNPGAAASLLASDATGKLTLPLFVASTSVTTPLVTAGSGQSLTLAAPLDLILDPTSTLTRMGSGVAIQASSYASQTTGWRVTDAGEGDFRYLFTDELHAKSFIADLEQALAGGQIISKSVGIVAEEFTLPAGGAYATLRVRDLPSAPNMAVFQTGDFVGLRQFSRSAGSLTTGWAWGVVTLYADGTGGNEGTQTWRFTRNVTTPGAATGTIPAEAIALDFGVSGNGFYEVNAIDGAYGANSPYAQVVTWSTHPATQTVRSRFGHLRGIFNVADEYGIYAGSGTSVTSRYIRASSSVVELRNVPLALYDGTNNTMLLSAGASNNSPFMALGSPLPTGPLVENGIWMGKDGSVYEFRVGTVSAGALVAGMHWDGANLVWKATNTSLDANGNLTATNATLSGTVTANAGAIGGWTIAASGLTATNIGLYSGAANTARVQVGSGSDVAGLNAPAAAGDIAFWAGDTHANRASADFRVTAAGAMYATTGTIAGDFTVTSGGKLTASGGGIVLTATGINVGLYDNLDPTVAPSSAAKAINWYVNPAAPGTSQARMYVAHSGSGANPYWQVVVDPTSGSSPRMALWQGGGGVRSLWFENLTQAVGLPGLYLATGTPNIVEVQSGARLQLSSGSSFVATTHLQAGTASAYDLGTSGAPWRKLYVDEVVAATISGGTALSGNTWQRADAGDMYIKSLSDAANRTLYVSNPGAGLMHLDVEGNITLTGTVDGVDIASFKSAYDSHAHAALYYTKTELQTSGQASVHWGNLTNKPTAFAPAAHVLATNLALGADHTISGATAGHVLRASGPTAAAFVQLAHGDLSGIGTNSHATIDTHLAATATHGATGAVVGTTNTQTLTNKTLTTPTIGDFTNAGHAHTNAASGGTIAHGSLTGVTADQHHAQSHSVIGGDHTIVASALQVVGATATNTLGLLTPSSNPGAAAAILASNSSGHLRLVRLGIGIDPTVPLHVSGNIKATGSIDADVQFLGQAADSATAPSFSWTADTNTGVFQPAADTVAFATAGVERLRIISTGKVGIGVTPSVGMLDITPPAATPGIVINRATGQASIKAGATDGYLMLESTGEQIRLNHYVADDVWIASGGGNVRVGSNVAAVYDLDVTGDIRSTGNLYVDGGMVNLYGSGIVDFGTNTITEDGTNLKVTGAKPVLLAQTIQASGWSMSTGGALIANSLSAASGALTGALTVGQDFTVGSNVLYVNQAGTRVGINRAPDSQFDLDVAGAIRGQYLVGKHALQLDNAYALIHFDGPGPYNLDFTGTSTSHMGNVATETGGVIYRPGLYSKAIQLAEATTNLVPNPSYEVATASANLLNCTVSLSDDADVGEKSMQLSFPSGSAPGISTTRCILQYVTLTASTTYSLQCRYKIVSTGGGTWNIGVNGNEGFSSSAAIADGEWHTFRTTVTKNATTGAEGIQIHLEATTLVADAIILVDAYQVEQKNYATSYCDGSLGSGHSWSGTAHASTSSRTAGSIDFGKIVNRSQYTIAGWFKVNLPENQTISSVWRPVFFQIGTYNTNPSMRLGTYSTNVNIGIFSRNTTATGWTLSGVNAGNIDYVTGEWVFVAVTYDGTKHTVYAQRAGQDTIITTVMANTPEHYGYGERLRLAIDASVGLDLVDEVIVLDVAADAKLIRSIYHSNAPVFAESSVVSFRSPSKAPIWVDEFGLWGRGVAGGAIIGIYGGNPRWKTGDPADTRSWGGISMEENDLVIGRISAPSYTAIHWDDSAGEMILGRQAAEHVSLASGYVRIRSNTTTYAQLAAGVLSLGDTGAEHVLVNTSGVALKDSGVTYAQFAATTTIGATATEHVSITSSTMQFKDGVTNVYTELTGGVLTLGLVSGGEYMTIDGTNGLRLYSAATLLGQWTAAGGVVIGEVAASKGNVAITAGAVSVRLNTTERIGLTAAGVLTVKDSGGAAVFTLDAAAGAEFTKPLTIGTSGGIYQGTGTFASPTTGLKIWNDSGVGRIAGYNAGTAQWHAGTDGKLYAVGGQIGGWTLASTTLTGGNAVLSSTGVLTLGSTSATRLIASAAHASYRLWIGDDDPTLAEFSVTTAGVLDATGAIISGAITATSGSITGNLSIGSAGTLYSGAATWQSAGYQLQYNTGTTPRMYIGDGGVTTGDKYLMWDGSNLSFRGTNTSLTTAGKFSASDVEVTGIINAESGSITGTLTIGASGKITTNRLDIDQSGASVRVATDWDVDAGYRLNNAGTIYGGLYGFSGTIANYTMLLTNKSPTSATVVETKDAYTGVEAYTGITKTAGVVIQAVTLNAGSVAKQAQIFVTASQNSSSSISMVATSAAPTYNSNVMWHAGNDGPSSTLNADLLDGLEATAFSLTGHNHTGVYAAASHTHDYGNITGNGNIVTTGTISAGANLNTAHSLGMAKIGYNASFSGSAVFAQKDFFTSAGYALSQNSEGYTFINAVDGKYISLRIANVEVAKFSEGFQYLNGYIALQEIATAPDATKLTTGVQGAIFIKDDKLYIGFRRSDGAMRYWSLDLTDTTSSGSAVPWMAAGSAV